MYVVTINQLQNLDISWTGEAGVCGELGSDVVRLEQVLESPGVSGSVH